MNFSTRELMIMLHMQRRGSKQRSNANVTPVGLSLEVPDSVKTQAYFLHQMKRNPAP